MADEVKLVTFAGETVTPTYDAIMQELYTNGGGIITGATVTIKDANTLHIADGYAAICGREVKIFASDIPVTLSSSGTLNGRLYLHMDLSQPTNPLTLLTEVAASLTPVQQDANVNTTNGIYEINLATFSVGTSTISNLVSVAPTIKNINARTLQTVNDCVLSTDPQDIAGAAAVSALNSKIADLGTVVMGTNLTTSVAKNTWVSIAKLELTKGTWVITGGYEYSSGFSARAVTQLYVGNVLLNGTYVDAKGDNGGGYNVARVYNTTSANVNIYMQAFQASTATQTVIHCDLRAVRIA